MIDVRREVINHIEVRWRDGFRPVSEAHGALADKLQELAAASKPARGEVRYELLTVELDDRTSVPVGTLRLDVHVRSSSRELRYFHAAVFPAHRGVTEAEWRRLVESRYGDDPAASIQEAYEVAATQARDQGGETVERFAIREADVRLVLGPPAPPQKVRARSVSGAPPVRALGLSTLVGLALGATLMALTMVTCREPRRPSTSAGVDAAELQRQLQALTENHADLEQRLRSVTDLLSTRTTELKACQAGTSNPGCTAELRELAAAKDKAARLDTQLQAVTRERDSARKKYGEVVDSIRGLCRDFVGPRPQLCKGQL